MYFKIPILFLLFSISTFAQKLSKEATFGLITVEAGSSKDAVYQVWGHAVIHLNDPVNNINLCFDYGTFDFNKEGFYVKFLKGTLPYQMAVYDYNRFIYNYEVLENRNAMERILNLNEIEKQKLFDFLNNNYKPENREYNYRFFYYNCASRIRDILEQICGKNIVFSPKIHADSSYRNWVSEVSGKKLPWTEFGMNVLLGMPSDIKTGAVGAMFLPQNLADGFSNAHIYHNGKKENLVLKIIPLTNVTSVDALPKLFLPKYVLLLFFIFGLSFTFWQLKTGNRNLIFDKIVFTVVGVLGCLVFFLSFFTDHGVTEKNLNLMWAHPIWIVAVFGFKKSKMLSTLFLIFSLFLGIFTIAYGFLPQGFPSGLWFFMATLFVRALFLNYYIKYGKS